MNERIKELAKKATKEVWGNNPHNGAPEFEGYELDQEKFAELIIEDFLQTCEAHPTWSGRAIGEQIKQQFEVEE
jgi:hypothetical protein